MYTKYESPFIPPIILVRCAFAYLLRFQLTAVRCTQSGFVKLGYLFSGAKVNFAPDNPQVCCSFSSAQDNAERLCSWLLDCVSM